MYRLFISAFSILTAILGLQACNTCDCKGEENKPKFNTVESKYIPKLGKKAKLIFKHNTKYDTLFYYKNAYYIEPDCVEPVIFPSSCCICPADESLSVSITFSEDRDTVYVKRGFLEGNFSKDRKGFRRGFIFRGQHIELDNIPHVDSIQVDNQLFSNVWKFNTSVKAESPYGNPSATDFIHTVYYAPNSGIIKMIKNDSSVWNRQF